MSSGMFGGKESSNRIELSQLVQELLILVFSAPCGLWEHGGMGGWGLGGGWGCPTHMCTCTRMLMHAHACMVNMIISCKWLPPLDLGKSWGFPYDVICMCTCMWTCVGGTLSPPPPPSTHPHPSGGTPGIHQNSIALKLIEIFQLSLKIWNLWRLLHPWVGA